MSRGKYQPRETLKRESVRSTVMTLQIVGNKNEDCYVYFVEYFQYNAVDDLEPLISQQKKGFFFSKSGVNKTFMPINQTRLVLSSIFMTHTHPITPFDETAPVQNPIQ